MTMEFIPTIEQLIDDMEKQGLGTFASKLGSIKNTVKKSFKEEQYAPQPGTRVPRGLARPPARTRETPIDVVPTGPARPFAQGEEEVTMILPNRREVKVKYKDLIEKGILQPERIPAAPTTVPALTAAGASETLLEVSKKASAKGYSILGKRLKEASEKVAAMAAKIDHHQFPSLEAAYEASSSSEDWTTNVKKVVDTYEGVAGILKMFIKTHRETAQELSKGGASSEDSEKIMSLLRKTDEMIARKAQELVRKIQNT